jgi:hypothetical protein
MNETVAGQVVDITRKMVNLIAGFQSINGRAIKELANHRIAVTEAFVTISSKQIRRLGNSKSVQDMFNTQAEIVSDVGKIMIDNAWQMMALLDRTQDELNELIDQELNEIAKRVKRNSQ